MFEQKTIAFNLRIKNYMTQQQKPLTLKLICKYAFPKPKYPEGVLEQKPNENESAKIIEE